MIKVAIPGGAGRMGRALIQAVQSADEMEISGASELPGSPALGQDAGVVAGLPPAGVPLADSTEVLLEGATGVIDFTLPGPAMALARQCATRGLPLVIGTTGFTEENLSELAEIAQKIPMVLAPNMSVGINVLLRLVEETARLLGPDYDLEIIEAHHRNKVDAPSGTAIRLAQVLAEATGNQGPLEERCEHGRQGATGVRPREQIGIHAVRGGDIVGEHTVMYCGEGERLELTHRASSRQTFARGAVRALRWLINRPVGLYDMQDVLGLRSII